MKLVAYITATERRVLRWAGRRLLVEGSFAADDAGLRAWGAGLARHRGAPLALVVDLAGEEFHEERVPRLRGRDRMTLLGRRLAQRFGDARFTAAWPLQDNAAQDGHERIILASLGSRRELHPWLDTLRTCGVHLTGIHSTASLAPAILERCMGRNSSAIVLAALASGLRECWIEGGRLRYARFVPTGAVGAGSSVRRIREEADRLVAYLATLGNTPAREGVPLLAIADDTQSEAIQRDFAADSRFALRFLGSETVARCIGLPGTSADGGAESVFLALAACRPPREQFASPLERRGYLHARLRRAMLAGGMAACAACTAFAGTQWLEALDLRDRAARASQETQAVAQRRQRIAAELPRPTADLESLRSAALEVRRLASAADGPEPAFVHLSRTLTLSPRIELEALGWSSVPQDMPGSSSSGHPVQRLEITARVTPASADIRELAGEIAAFTNRLAAEGGWRIASSRLPFDLTPGGTLRGGDGSTGIASGFGLVIERVAE